MLGQMSVNLKKRDKCPMDKRRDKFKQNATKYKHLKKIKDFEGKIVRACPIFLNGELIEINGREVTNGFKTFKVKFADEEVLGCATSINNKYKKVSISGRIKENVIIVFSARGPKDPSGKMLKGKKLARAVELQEQERKIQKNFTGKHRSGDMEWV